MLLSASGRQMLKGFEGLRLEAYPDGTNEDGSPKYSIGYGHSGAKKGDRIMPSQADSLFDADVAERERAVADAVALHVTTPGQFDALVSLAYNIGLPAFRSSTLLRLHNASDYAGAAEQFSRWVHSGGKVDPRLTLRRNVERDLYRNASPSLMPATGDPLEVAEAGGLGMMLFFCPSCSSPCDVRFSVARAEPCPSQADHLGTVVHCEQRAKHRGDHTNDRLVWTDAQALPRVVRA
jgi:lysozyme